eukprot:1159136-Pelagomonas_calceolata.AAC.7
MAAPNWAPAKQQVKLRGGGSHDDDDDEVFDSSMLGDGKDASSRGPEGACLWAALTAACFLCPWTGWCFIGSKETECGVHSLHMICTSQCVVRTCSTNQNQTQYDVYIPAFDDHTAFQCRLGGASAHGLWGICLVSELSFF